jgi:hypothetical protein
MGTKRKEGKLDWINEDALAIIELANTDEPGTSNVKFKDAEFTIFTQLNETTGTHTIKVTGVVQEARHLVHQLRVATSSD